MIIIIYYYYYTMHVYGVIFSLYICSLPHSFGTEKSVCLYFLRFFFVFLLFIQFFFFFLLYTHTHTLVTLLWTDERDINKILLLSVYVCFFLLWCIFKYDIRGSSLYVFCIYEKYFISERNVLRDSCNYKFYCIIREFC